MIRILTGVKVRHAPCGAILRQITASKGSKDMYRRRLGPGSDSRRGTSRVGESVYQAPVTAGSETSDRQLCTGRAGRAGEPRQLPAVILFTAGNFSISSFDSFREAGFSAAPSLPARFGPTHRIPCVYVK